MSSADQDDWLRIEWLPPIGAAAGRTDRLRGACRGAESNVNSRRGAMVVLQEPAERFLATDIGSRRNVFRRCRQLSERSVAQRLVRSLDQIMADVFRNNVIQ